MRGMGLVKGRNRRQGGVDYSDWPLLVVVSDHLQTKTGRRRIIQPATE